MSKKSRTLIHVNYANYKDTELSLLKYIGYIAVTNRREGRSQTLTNTRELWMTRWLRLFAYTLPVLDWDISSTLFLLHLAHHVRDITHKTESKYQWFYKLAYLYHCGAQFALFPKIMIYSKAALCMEIICNPSYNHYIISMEYFPQHMN